MAMPSDSSTQVEDGLSVELPEEDGSLVGYDACLGVMPLPNLFRNQISSAVKSNCQDCITLLVGNPAGFSTDPPVDVEKGCSDSSAEAEAPRDANSEGAVIHVQKALQRQISIHLGGKFGQHLLEYFLVLLRIYPKAERGHDTGNNRWRRYKRSASFDSRKVVLFFSVVSSMGTLILICLTLSLRVRQTT
uniref:Uncharacterized protein n=1 Tax=Kalanchoe fedtschenkoi TaxID=63787 RepID=A0A7N0T7F8_KALFE